MPPTSDPSRSTLLRTEQLGRIAQGKVLVENATFEVNRGDVLALVGPSGSGKTSLLRMLNRLDEPTSGTVYLEGIDYVGIAPAELRRRVGMVTQRPFLFPGTVGENLGYGPRQRGEQLSQSSMENLLTQVGLPDYAARNVANLSGGESQRVSLARTLSNMPLLLLLDEPTSALDDSSKLGIEHLIQAIVQDRGLTCVIVTHDRAQAIRLCTRTLIMEAGRVVRQGPTDEVLGA